MTISGEDHQKVEGVLVGFVASKGCARMVARKLVGQLREDDSEKVAQEASCYRVLTFLDVFLAVAIVGGEGRVVVRWW